MLKFVNRKMLFGTLFVFGLALAQLTVASTPAVAAGVKDCDDNAIIRCGLNDADPIGDFVAKYNQNATGDLDDIFGYDGIELQSLRENAKLGYVTKGGQVYKYGDKTGDPDILVATNAVSLGRQPRSNGTPVERNGVTYHLSYTHDSFKSDVIPAIISMNGNEFTKAILTSCGNLVRGTSVGAKPTYNCDMLQKTKVNDNTYKFSAKATATSGAVISEVVYDFGDGSQPKHASPTEVVEHTYATPGNYTAKLTVKIKINGATIELTGGECQKPIEVKAQETPKPKPIYACSALNVVSVTPRVHVFTAVGQVEGGAVLQSATFDFDDDTEPVKDVAPTATNQVSLQHEFAEPGTYNVEATLKFTTPDSTRVKSKKCQVEVVVPEATTVTTTTTPPTPPAPNTKEAPQELPSTGPAEVAGGLVGLSGIMASGYYYMNSRRNLLGTLFKIK